MSVFIETTIECSRCKKRYKTFSAFDHWSVLDGPVILPFCKACSKELKRLVKTWIKMKTIVKPYKHGEKRTPDQWYQTFFTINSVFCYMPPSKQNKNKKITEQEFEKKYIY